MTVDVAAISRPARLWSILLTTALCVGVLDAAVVARHVGATSMAAAGAETVALRPASSEARAMAPPDPTVPTPPGTAAPAPIVAAALPLGPRRVPPWRVGWTTAHFVDTSRPAPARSGAGNGRTLDTVISYPIEGDPAAAPLPGGPPAARGGPFPLVVFVHGFNVTPTTYAALTQAWARAGYVVASPAFPGEVGGEDGATQDDLPNEPADVRFVISSMLAPGAPVRAAIDPTHIAVAGHSDGGEVAAGVGLDQCCLDPRVDATIVMSGARLGVAGSAYGGVHHAPALIIQSDSDEINDPSNAVALYNDSPGQLWYLDLMGGRHLEPFLGTDPRWAIVPRVTIDFLDLTLKNGPGRIDRFENDAIVAGMAKLYLKR